MLLFGKEVPYKNIDWSEWFILIIPLLFQRIIRKYTHESDYATREEQQDLLKQ